MRLPAPPPNLEGGLTRYLSTLINALVKSDTDVVRRNTAQPSILLASPDGSVYTVAVNNSGVLVTTKVFDGS